MRHLKEQSTSPISCYQFFRPKNPDLLHLIYLFSLGLIHGALAEVLIEESNADRWNKRPFKSKPMRWWLLNADFQPSSCPRCVWYSPPRSIKLLRITRGIAGQNDCLDVPPKSARHRAVD